MLSKPTAWQLMRAVAECEPLPRFELLKHIGGAPPPPRSAWAKPILHVPAFACAAVAFDQNYLLKDCQGKGGQRVAGSTRGVERSDLPVDESGMPVKYTWMDLVNSSQFLLPSGLVDFTDEELEFLRKHGPCAAAPRTAHTRASFLRRRRTRRCGQRRTHGATERRASTHDGGCRTAAQILRRQAWHRSHGAER